MISVGARICVTRGVRGSDSRGPDWYLKITDPENANEPTAYTMLRGTPGTQEEKDQAFYQAMFQFLQYQAGQLVAKALETAAGNPYKVVEMMRYHHPSIERAAAVDAVMKPPWRKH